MSASREQTLERLARFDASTGPMLARLDADAARLEALAEQLRDDAQRQPTSDEQAGMMWWNALTERARAEWLAHAGTGCPVDAWNAFRRRYPDVSPHAAFLDANVLRAPRQAATNWDKL